MSAPTFNPPVTCLLCGAPASPGARFCARCGALLPDAPSAAQSPELDLEQLFTLQGRIGRSEFFVTAVVLSLLYVFALGLLAALSGNILGVVLGGALCVAAAFALTAAAIKRLHDAGTSGWPAIVVLIPFIGWFVILVLALIGPSSGQNAYGDPHNGSLRPVGFDASASHSVWSRHEHD